jgi:integrase
MKNTIEAVPCVHPRYSYRVRFYGPDGKRADRYFTNKTEADAFAKVQSKESGKVGADFGFISEEERAALAFWRTFAKDTSPAPPDLLSVMKDFKVQWLASKASVTITQGIQTFLEHQEADGASKRHLASLRSRLGRFAADMGDKHASAVTVGSFTDWLNGLRATRADKAGEKLTAVTRHNLSRSLRSFFVFAMDRGWTLANPIPAEKRTKNKSSKLANRKAPAVLLPADVARFMGAVEAKSPSLVPFWAVKFFAGIRDAEAARMTWEMIDLAAGKIHLPASDSKTGEARTMKIEPSLAAWLKPYAKESGAICPGGTTRKRGFKRAVDSLATVDAKGRVTKEFVFPSNAARHSFGTYHLFHFRNAGETALQLGHKSNPAMLHEHYKNPTAEKHAAAFWKVLPAKDEKATKSAKNITNIESGRKTA